jgi:redox-sensing transcriptional repressor
MGCIKVFSDNLADAVGVTSAQVRKDFSLFGIEGNRRGGYQIETLLENINSILGKDHIHHVIVVGLGNIGTALMKYRGFEKERIRIVAGFETDRAKYSRVHDIPVMPVDELPAYVRRNGIRIGIIAVPDTSAQEVADLMMSAGVKGILNFAPIRLRCSSDVVINNVNVEHELENVIYFVSAAEKTVRKSAGLQGLVQDLQVE